MSATGRPRDPTYDRRVLVAARDELAEHGIGRFSVRRVARRANVPRTSIALRWPDSHSLIIAAVDGWTDVPGLHDTGSLREDLLLLADDLSVILEPPHLGFQLRLGADAPHHPDLFEVYLQGTLRPRMQRVQAAFERAVARGEMPAQVDVLWETDAFVGALLMRTMGRRGLRPPGRAARAKFVDQTIRKLTNLRDRDGAACPSSD